MERRLNLETSRDGPRECKLGEWIAGEGLKGVFSLYTPTLA